MFKKRLPSFFSLARAHAQFDMHIKNCMHSALPLILSFSFALFSARKNCISSSFSSPPSSSSSYFSSPPHSITTPPAKTKINLSTMPVMRKVSCACVYSCVYACMYTCVYACMYTCVHVHVCVCACAASVLPNNHMMKNDGIKMMRRKIMRNKQIYSIDL